MRGLKLHRPELSAAQRQAEAERVFEVVGLSPAAEVLQRYPHELSGGQRQRVGFAQALALRPKLILADEPVSMLDVSIRIGLLNLMARLRDEEGVSILYITHDIASARYVADRLIVMYAGQIAESGPVEEVLAAPGAPVHPAAAVRGARPARAAGRDRGSRPAASRPRSSTRRRAAGSAPAARWPSTVPAGHPGARPSCVPGTRPRALSRRRAAEVRACSMKIAVVGGGSTYTPELVNGVGEQAGTGAGLKVTELVLVDPDETRLAAVGPVSARDHARRTATRPGSAGRPAWTRASTGPGAVLLQLRVGGQAARQRDETWPLDCGCVGQETTGAGGLAKALRTVPIVLDIAERARQRADPGAWIIDFTNPVGIVTRALLDAGHRAVGLCNVAIGFQRLFARLLGAEPGRVRWITSASTT